MTKEKAVRTALKIVDICKRYGNTGDCLQCPFNIKGCILTDGNNIPSDWKIVDLLKSINS